GGHFSISDIVLDGELPEKLRKAAEMYAGCVSGAIQQSDYLQILKDAGFSNISVQKEKPIIVPNDILKNYLSEDEILAYHNSNISIRSITVYGEKKKTCCGPECC
ncbi:MAG: arsenite S-adenosylmethyltransferase, partial [Saprospiraceae bacterium]|nr:arsenite S-adenosylmethyltransferase [Saprospiraceae bacterium]